MKLEIKNLSVTLDRQPILRDVSLEVRNGEFLSLLGPSGCGKSTMLKTIAGLLPVSGGEIYLGDQEVSRIPTHKRGTVVVFQDLRMFPHMTALENVKVGMHNHIKCSFVESLLHLPSYRRAEKAERAAKERSQQIYRQATATLAQATAQVDDAAGKVQELVDRVTGQITDLQAAVALSKSALLDAATTMYSIRPEDAE